MTDTIPTITTSRPITSRSRKSARAALIGAGLLALGIGGGATVARMSAPAIEMAPLKPVAVRSLVDGEAIVTVRGKVAEVYGPAFILADGSGRALVDAGKRHGLLGESALVAVGQTVSVQGRFRDGTLHASFLVGADGTVTALHRGPRGGPDGGPGGPGHRGPGGDPRGPDGHGPDAGPDGRDMTPAVVPPTPASMPPANTSPAVAPSATTPAATGNRAG